MTTQAEPSAPAPRMSRKRSWGIRALVVLGCALLLVSALAIWVDRLLLDPSRLADTSEQALLQREVQEALGAYITDQLYASVDIQAELERVLPSTLDSLAGPAAAGLREYARRATVELLGRPRVIAAWGTAVERSGRLFVLLAEDGARRFGRRAAWSPSTCAPSSRASSSARGSATESSPGSRRKPGRRMLES